MSEHDVLIAEAARRHLRPLGFQRKGRSRVWLRDQGWWVCVVEFQPSGWGKGSYLNVAAHWLWSDSGRLSFDYGGRIAGFSPADEAFATAVDGLAASAAEEALQLAALFGSIDATADVLQASSNVTDGSWGAYNAAIAAGLAGRMADASRLFAAVTDRRGTPSVERVGPFADDPVAFEQAISALIADQRKALRLPSTSANGGKSGEPSR